jgi:hypothetical protein
MRKIRIREYDVILENLGEGQGKVIIASPYLNTSYYWGSMGGTLEEFICSIDLYYWSKNLLPRHVEEPLNVRKTFAAFRKQLKENLCDSLYSYGWWLEREFQSDMWGKVREMQESVDDVGDFIEAAFGLPKRMDYHLIADKYDAERFEEAIQNACSEPWYYAVRGQSREQGILTMLYTELRKILKAELKPAL